MPEKTKVIKKYQVGKTVHIFFLVFARIPIWERGEEKIPFQKQKVSCNLCNNLSSPLLLFSFLLSKINGKEN